MDQRLNVDAEVSKGHVRDRQRVSSMASGPTLSSATSFALGGQAQGASSLEDMIAALPSETNIVQLVNLYYVSRADSLISARNLC